MATLITEEREQIEPLGNVSGWQQADIIGNLPVLSLARSAPNEPNDQPLLTIMKTFLSVFAAYVAASAFGVAFVQTALQAPLQQHSGTQPFVRVVR